MKEMDSLGLKMCKYQADLFEKSADSLGCSSGVFIRRFMNSDLAKRMDNVGFMFDVLDTTDAFVEIESQYGASSYGSEKYSHEELYWIGYMYRYWAYVTGLSSRQIYKETKPGYLKKAYFPYHSLDPMQAIDRIMEEQGKEPEQISDIARGVEIVRRVRAELRDKSDKKGRA